MGGDTLRQEVDITNQRGLHARASAKFVETVSKFQARVKVSKDGTTVDGASIMGLMLLAAAPGCCITIETSGAEAEAAMAALTQLVADKFYEE